MAKDLATLLLEKLGTEAHPVENPEISSVGTTAAVLFRANPNRVALLVVNLSSNAMYLGWFRDPSSTKGIRLGPNGGRLTSLYDEDFNVVAREWYIVAAGAGSNLFSMELVTR